MVSSLSGIITPLITPIQSDEMPDLDSMRRLVEYQIAGGVQGLWVMGTSGEFASFDRDERAAITEAAIDAANGRCPTVVNVSDASTRGAIAHARCAERLGATALAVTPPYYYPHGQDELLTHYRAVRDVVDLPLFLYNIPQTVRVAIDMGTAKTLAQDGVAAGIKDSQNNLEWFRQLALFARDEKLPFRMFAGTRHLIDAAILAGGHGAIPSIANVYPDLCVRVAQSAISGDFSRAATLENPIIAVESVMGQIKGGSRNAATLGVIKHLLHRKGIISWPGLTRPLRALTAEDRAFVDARVGAIESAMEL